MEKEKLLERMEQSIDALIRETELLAEEEFDTLTITGTWTAKEILSHVAAWDLIFADMSRKMAKNESIPELPDFETFNSEEVKKRRKCGRRDIVNEVRKNRKAYIQVLDDISEEHMKKSGYAFTIEGLAQDIMSHELHHLKQIRKKTTHNS